MAANNYFGFTHSGTQYTATPGAAAAAAAYQAQGGYAVAPTGASTPAATYTTQRAATGYDYSAGTTAYAVPSAAPTAASATTYDYGYARTAAQAYDTSKTYYQQPVASAASYSTTDYSGWTQASSAQKPAPAVSAVYTYSQPGQRSTQPAVQKPASVAGLQATTQPAYSTQTYGSASAGSTYGASAYSTVQNQNKFASAGSTGAQSQIKKAVPQSYTTPQSALSYNAASSYVTQSPGVTSSYNTYSAQNKVATAAGGLANSGQKTTLGTGLRSNVGGSTPSSSYSSSYDQALYNAALYNVNQGSGAQTAGASGVTGAGGQNSKPQWKNYNKNTSGTGTANTFNKFQRPKQPPKPQQIHYCEVCKISCAGPLTYKEHLEGSRHKKKEQAQKAASGEGAKEGARGSAHPPRGTVFKCDLCSVTCTGTDAYSAHLRGVKHQKVVKLHQKLGKPIPEPDPKATAILRAKAEAAEAAKAAAGTAGSGDKVVSAAPKINFVASGSLNTTSKGDSTTATPSEKSSEDVDMIVDDNILPVGQEFVEEIKTDDGKLQTFHCKLCDCKFNDPNAKDMHMKGKRHRLAYKKKVDPTLVVEIKPNYFQKKQKEQRERMRLEYARRREEERVNFWTDKLLEHEERRYWEEIRRYEEEMEYYDWNVRRMGAPHHAGGPMGPPMPLPPRPGPPGPRGMLPPPPVPPALLRGGPPRMETYDDRHVIAKHEAILPRNEQLATLSHCVDSVEKALKNVSDLLVEEVIKAEEVKTEKKEADVATSGDAATPAATEDKKKDNLKSLKEKEEKRVLKGVNRVSALAKNILLQGEMSAELIVLCAEKPTLTLLRQVIQYLPEQLKLVAPTETFDVTMKPEEAGFLVTRQKQIKPEPAPDTDLPAVTDPSDAEPTDGPSASSDVIINVVLTSPVIREELLERQAAEAAAKAAAEAKAKAEAEAKKVAAEGGKPVAAAATIVKQEPKEPSKPPKPEPKDLLDPQKCLEALASLRHAKWFQAKAEPQQSCVMIIRLLRHLGQAWNLINPWALELLVEKVIASAGLPLSPGDALRRVFEAVASGLLLESGPGLLDPCEKEPRDALANMPAQDREDVTVAAQIGLRQMAFHQIHKLLGMEQLKLKRGFGGSRSANRKRRRDTSSGEKEDGGVKKDKKEEEESAGIKTETMETKLQDSSSRTILLSDGSSSKSSSRRTILLLSRQVVI
ncbi:hypothetical protein M8J77_014704 [Diaphorina citri]|nr:hypothetical protein M8J77_014704 [Diaphorina citri]